jgi:hypothetical protein
VLVQTRRDAKGGEGVVVHHVCLLDTVSCVSLSTIKDALSARIAHRAMRSDLSRINGGSKLEADVQLIFPYIALVLTIL